MNVHSFISAISENRQAFDLFKEKASKRGLGVSSPKALMHQQQDYYERYIKSTKSPKQLLRSREVRNSCSDALSPDSSRMRQSQNQKK